MKFELEIEATPAEARSFLGLPDLTPLHDAWIERMKSYTMTGPSTEDWQKMMTSWTSGMPGMGESMEAWQKMMALAMTPTLPKPPELK